MKSNKVQAIENILDNCNFENINRKIFDKILFEHEANKHNVKQEVNSFLRKIKLNKDKIKKLKEGDSTIEDLKDENYELTIKVKNKKKLDFDNFYDSIAQLFLKKGVNYRGIYSTSREEILHDSIKVFFSINELRELLEIFRKIGFVKEKDSFYTLNEELFGENLIFAKDLRDVRYVIKDFLIPTILIETFNYGNMFDIGLMESLLGRVHSRIGDVGMSIGLMRDKFKKEQNIILDFPKMTSIVYDIEHTPKTNKRRKQALRKLKGEERETKLQEIEENSYYGKNNIQSFAEVYFAMTNTGYGNTEEVREIYTNGKQSEMLKSISEFEREKNREIQKNKTAINRCKDLITKEIENNNDLGIINSYKEEIARYKKEITKLRNEKSENHRKTRRSKLGVFTLKNNQIKNTYLIMLLTSLGLMKRERGNFFSVNEKLISVFEGRWKSGSIRRLFYEILFSIGKVKDSLSPMIQFGSNNAILFGTYHKEIEKIKIINGLGFCSSYQNIKDYLEQIKSFGYEIKEEYSNVTKKTSLIIVREGYELGRNELRKVLEGEFKEVSSTGRIEEIKEVKKESSLDKLRKAKKEENKENKEVEKEASVENEIIEVKKENEDIEGVSYHKKLDDIIVGDEIKQTVFTYLSNDLRLYKIRFNRIRKLIKEKKLDGTKFLSFVKGDKLSVILYKEKDLDFIKETGVEKLLSDLENDRILSNFEYNYFYSTLLLGEDQNKKNMDILRDHFNSGKYILITSQNNGEKNIIIREEGLPEGLTIKSLGTGKALLNEQFRNYVHAIGTKIGETEDKTGEYIAYFGIDFKNQKLGLEYIDKIKTKIK